MKTSANALHSVTIIDGMLTFSASLAYLYGMKRPKLQVLPYRHSKRYPYYLDLRPFGKGRRFFKTKVEAEAERLRQITTLARHGREAVGGTSAILRLHRG